MGKVTDAPPLSPTPSSTAATRTLVPAQAAANTAVVVSNDADLEVGDVPQWAAVGAGVRKAVPVEAADPVAAVTAPPPPANVAPGDAMADAMQTISDFFGEPKLAKDADALRTAKPEKLEKVSRAFEKHMAKVRDEYSKLKNDPSKQAEFEKHFGALDGQLSAVGMSAEDLFNAASTGPQHLAERILRRARISCRGGDVLEGQRADRAGQRREPQAGASASRQRPLARQRQLRQVDAPHEGPRRIDQPAHLGPQHDGREERDHAGAATAVPRLRALGD